MNYSIASYSVRTIHRHMNLTATIAMARQSCLINGDCEKGNLLL